MIQRIINLISVFNFVVLISLLAYLYQQNSIIGELSKSLLNIESRLSKSISEQDDEIDKILDELQSLRYKVNNLYYSSGEYSQHDVNSIYVEDVNSKNSDSKIHIKSNTYIRPLSTNLCDALKNGGMVVALYGLSGYYAEACKGKEKH